MSLACNLAQVRQKIAEAATKAGRKPEEIQLIAVSKNVDFETMLAAVELGIRDFGENRVQEARQKISAMGEMSGKLRFHMIGHLQRNKVAHALRMFQLIHSVDSLRLLEAIERKSREFGITARVLLQVNVSGEETKGGFKPEELGRVLDAVAGLDRVQVMGLMTIAPYTDNPESVRPVFARLRQLAQMDPSRLRHLSMGMSGDYQIAIEEGATMVRIGTAIFGPRCYTRGEN